MPIEMLKLHWKATRWLLLPFLVAAFAIPMMNLTGGPFADLLINRSSFDFLYLSESLGGFYPFIAGGAGIVLALTAWNWDHQKGHIYPLSLPISRAQYSVLKFGSGVILLMIPTLVLLVSAVGFTSMMDLPYGLQAYPLALTARFFLAGLTTYALLFALASGTIKTTVMILGGAFLFFGFGFQVQELAATWIPQLQGWSITGVVADLLASEYGPIRVFAGNWNLVDV